MDLRGQPLADYVRSFVLSAEHYDESTFLGAQFDAGLAWVHNQPGDGGLGLSPPDQQVVDGVLQECDRLYDWHRNPMGIGMCAPAIAAHGSAEQRTEHLRRIFVADTIWCQLFSEPGAGSDLATLSSRARRDGDVWRVDGQKVWTSWGGAADVGLLLARTDPDVPKHEGLTAFIVDMHGEGVEVRPLRQMTGEREFSEVYFTNAPIPDSNRLGAVGDGWRVAVTTLMNERVSIGGGVEPAGTGPIGSALRVWDQTDARSTLQRHQLASLWIEAEVLRLMKIKASGARGTGAIPGPEGSLLKLANALLEQRIRAFVIHLLGADGMIAYDFEKPPRSRGDDHPTASFLWSPSNTIVGGTSEVMRNIIGERVLGLPAEPRADKGVAWNAIPRGA